MFTVLFLESYNRTRFAVRADVAMVAGTAPIRQIELEEGADLFGGDDTDVEIGHLFVVTTATEAEYRALVDGLREMGVRVKRAAMVDVDLTGADRAAVEGALYGDPDEV